MCKFAPYSKFLLNYNTLKYEIHINKPYTEYVAHIVFFFNKSKKRIDNRKYYYL